VSGIGNRVLTTYSRHQVSGQTEHYTNDTTLDKPKCKLAYKPGFVFVLLASLFASRLSLGSGRGCGRGRGRG